MVCKSCHPAQALAGIESERAPAMHDLWAATNLAAHTNANLDPYYTVTLDNACNVCHFAGNLQGAKTFGELHKGYNEQIYSDGNGARYDAAYVTSITSVSYDSPSYVGTVNFTLSGVSASTVVKWYPYVGLYGWDTKDFVVRVSPTASTAITSSSPGSYQLTFNLSTQSATIAADNVKRAEVVLLPEIGIDPTTAVSNTGANLAVASGGLTRTIDLTATSANALVSDASSYGKKIVDPTKCNACHDALATTFHNPTETYRGRAGVVACRVCHIVTTGASNFEMQSRSIDSFVHAAHAMQVVAAKNVDLTDPVQAMRYNDHVEGVFPNFAGPLNCEACHYPGTYDVPDQKKSLPSVLSALANVKGRTGLPYVTAGVLTGPGSSAVTGPAARACGACHRAFAINEGDGSKLAAFVGHVTDFGSMVDPGQFTTTSQYVEWAVGATTTVMAAPTGAQVERCEICHATAGSDHQTLFNTWRNGTK
jgi:OmcA/MtrC family decaheme c-type cytochrome